MAKSRPVTGSKLLGQDLRKRRGHRSLEEIARISRSSPFSDRVEPIAYSTLSMLERGLTMPSAQSLLSLSVVYQVPVQQYLDLIALERYHARKPGDVDAAVLELEIVEHLRGGSYGEAYAKTLQCLDIISSGATSSDAAVADGSAIEPKTRKGQLAAVRIYGGIALWKLGWLSQAEAAFRDIVDDAGIPPQLRGWAYQNLVEVERTQGRLSSAHAYARDGLDLAQHVGGERLQGTFHATLANLKRDLAEQAEDATVANKLVDDALRHHAKAQALARQCGDDFLLSNDLLNEGVTLALAGKSALARQRLEQGMVIAENNGYGRLRAFGWLERGKLMLAADTPDRAREFLWRAEQEAAAVEATDLLFLTYFYLLKTAEAFGDETQHAYRKCISLKSLQQGRCRELVEFETLQSRREAAS